MNAPGVFDASADLDALRAGYGVKWGSLAPDVLGAWVADMDFPVAPVIRRRIHEIADFGYPHWPAGDPVITAFEQRMTARHGWAPAPGRARVFSDLIQILQVMIEHATEPGDAIAIHVPTYPPFLASIVRAGRRVVPLPLPGDGPADLRDCAMLVLVNPHNPSGRVFTRTELAALADDAADHDVVVLADEIHADLVFTPHRHVPFASLGPAAATRTVTATSATKAFNIAGLRCAVAHIGPRRIRDALSRMPLDYFGQPGVLGRAATVAAWTEADDWLDGLLVTLAGNRDQVSEWAAGLPWAARYRPPEATYLAWLDCGDRFGPDPAAALLDRAGVKLSAGAEFAQHTAVDTGSRVRLNFATSPAVLTEMLTRLSAAIESAA
ncbi:aminotransferase [Actinoplanes italicus]|uniref:cysteine-S-conjugate beta-lyase n=1 Tax=Actinoplanes italicus TaxID=113567 RepID=A0A2T0JZA2_9ACTN|nr:aminotransferase class I/II-fold pyridoxal phosphate-dependent enzyme [Actinoplanes italicus]PRX15797.1 cystathionine beta-lyase [Actinoplanes italicus]GIE28595.1 aminotransferase [Actinoplanes italicus]